MIKNILALVLLMLFIAGCDQKTEISTEQKSESIRSKILDTGPALSQMEALFSLHFTHHSPNKILSDDFYIRRDQATAFYGYDLNKLKIKIGKKDGQDTLFVEFPEVILISTDRRIIEPPEYAHKNYSPKNDEGKAINVDHLMDKKLNSLISKYQSKSVEKTRELSELYFQALAKRHGLMLEIKYQ